MHSSSYNMMSKLLDNYIFINSYTSPVVLDFGSYDVNGSYRNLFTSTWNYIGIDIIEGPNVDYVPIDPYRWSQISNNSVDLVISGQALEHCEFPWLIFNETKRVLKYNALCIFIAPSSGHEHKYPVDCWRIYPDGMKALCKYANLDVLHCDTNWNPEICEDDSHIWKDTSLVAQNN